MEHALGVDVEHPRPVLVGGLRHRREAQDTGDVDAEIDRAPFPLDPLDQRLGLRARAHVERLGAHLRPQLRRQRLDAVRRDVGGDDARTLCMQGVDDRPAYASAGTGDDGDPAGDAAGAHGSSVSISAIARDSAGAIRMTASGPVRWACRLGTSTTSTLPA